MRSTVLFASLLGACVRPGVSPQYDTAVDVVDPVDDHTDPPAALVCPGPTDADGDGWDALADGGSDCDDFGAAWHPGAVDDVVEGADLDCDGTDGPVEPLACTPIGPETCDGVDEDCDGRVDDAFVAYVADDVSVSLAAPLLAGGAMAVVIGQVSAAPAIDGAVSVYDADGALVVRIDGTGQSPSFGQQIAAGRDLTGDGFPDLAVSAPFAETADGPNSGRVFVFAGPIGPTTTLADAVFTFVGGELDGQPGAELALAPDLTGDGLPELLVGYYRRLLLFSGAPAGEHRLADATATWELNTGGGAWRFATVPDTDGDALPELVLGMSTYASGAGFVGRWDSAGIGGAMGAADRVYPGAPGPDEAGYTGLGAGLVSVGGTLWTLATQGDTTVALALGDAGPTDVLAVAATGLADGGDLDGDGTADLLVGTAASVVAVGAEGTIGTWGGVATLQDERALAPATDLDGDGHPDPRVRGVGFAAVLDGAVAFAASCDADGDGVGVVQGDCDDHRADVTPLSGREACDGADNDCDGVVDAPAEAVLPARAVFAASLGDLDGDGTAELAELGADGVVTLLDGEDTLSIRALVTGGLPAVPYPFAGAGDTDGNGFVELLTSGTDAATLGPAGESGAAADLAATRFVDGTAWRREGRVGTAGDLDGDGLADVWLGVRDPHGSYGIAVLLAPFDALEDVADGAGVLTTPPSWDTFTVATARPGATADLDGDGHDDLLVGNPRSAYGDGRAYVFNGVPAGEVGMDDAALLQLFGETGEQMGTTVAAGGDFDGDGHDDALIGGGTGVRALSGAACPLLLPVRYAVGAEGVALVDLDDDGRMEAYLGDAGADGGAGAITRAVWGLDATPWRTGTTGEGLGSALWAVGDTDGAGGGDLLYGSATATTRAGGGCR